MAHDDHWLPSLLDHCIKTVPRYSRLPNDLKAFPVVNKPTMLGEMGAFISTDLLPDKRELTAFLSDSQRPRSGEIRWGSNIIVDETSGTSGVPFNFPKTLQERAKVALGIWSFRKTFDHFVTPSTFYPFSHSPIGFRHEIDPFDASPRNVRDLYESLNKKHIRWLHGYPSLFKSHASSLESVTWPPETKTISFIETSGSVLDGTLARYIAETFGVSVINQYGCREVWAIGYCRGGDDSFDVIRHNVLVEIITSDSAVIDTCNEEGRIIVTARNQRLFPFVRYETGDIGSWTEGGVGRTLRLRNFDRGAICILGDRRLSGDVFFRTLVNKALLKIGFVDIKFLQIRQVSPTHFLVLANDTERLPLFADTLANLCNADGNGARILFTPRPLSPNDLRMQMATKQRLFVPLTSGPKDAPI